MKNYQNHEAYIKAFNKVFGDRDELQPGEFECWEEHFDEEYKKEILRQKIKNIFTLYQLWYNKD